MAGKASVPGKVSGARSVSRSGGGKSKRSRR